MDTVVRAMNFYCMEVEMCGYRSNNYELLLIEVAMCGYDSKSYELLLYAGRNVRIRQIELCMQRAFY